MAVVSTNGWGGRRAVAARAALAATLPAPCSKCGRLVYPEQRWDLDHLIPRSVRPDLAWDPANHAPSHARCNRRAGQRITTAKRRANTPRPPRPSREW